MKIVVIGGSGLIGSKVVERLRAGGHEVLAASPASGVNTFTGEGLDQALAGAQVVLDVANSPVFQGKEVLEFFQTSGRNLLAAEAKAGVKHHLALSVVGTDRLPDSDYFRAKMEQERLIRESKIPYTIVHSTQFFEFLGSIAQSGADGDKVRLSPAFVQPIAADDIAAAVADFTVGSPQNTTVEVAGPERVRLSELVQRFLKASNDPRTVVPDVHARYFGAELKDDTLVPGPNPRIGALGFEAWFAMPKAPR
jgi:uncharacterized protein YbjT (DUF2867 family)